MTLIIIITISLSKRELGIFRSSFHEDRGKELCFVNVIELKFRG